MLVFTDLYSLESSRTSSQDRRLVPVQRDLPVKLADCMSPSMPRQFPIMGSSVFRFSRFYTLYSIRNTSIL